MPMFSTHSMKYFGTHLKKVNILYMFIHTASNVKHRQTISVKKMVKLTLQTFIHVIFIKLRALVTNYNNKYSNLLFIYVLPVDPF